MNQPSALKPNYLLAIYDKEEKSEMFIDCIKISLWQSSVHAKENAKIFNSERYIWAIFDKDRKVISKKATKKDLEGCLNSYMIGCISGARGFFNN